MGETVEKSRIFVKSVTDVFGKVDGERFNCPRCKGSGLNSGTTTEPCWFCEGVGVMPIIGLNGFMLGRCKPVINTKILNPSPNLPMKMQLYLGKFPETKCKVKTYRPSMNLSDLLFDSNQFPSLMNVAGGEVRNSGDTSSSLLTPTRTKSSEPLKQLVTQTGYRTNQIQAPVSSQKLQQPNPSTIGTSPRRPRVAPRRSSGSLFVTVRKTASASPPKVHSSSKYGVLADSSSGTSKNSRKSSLLRTPKSSRFPRGERNRVREEAEKEAFMRAYKLRNSSSEAKTSATSESPESRQPGGEKVEHLMNLSLGGVSFVNAQDSWRWTTMASRKVSPDATAINQFALGKVEGLVRTPSLGKAF